MVCKACGTEIPKKLRKCPSCGWQVRREPKNIRPFAIAGAVISFIGGFLPFIQNSSSVKKFAPAYGMMNYEQPLVWYAFMLLLVASIIICAVKYEKFSIITTVLAAVIFGIAYNNTCGRHGAAGMMNGLGLPVVLAGTVISVLGCFFDVYKFKKKGPEVDPHFTGNSSTLKQKLYVNRWFYLMALPVVIFLVIFNYLPMLGLRYSFTDYISGNTPVYVGIKHFVSMFGLSKLAKLDSAQFFRAFWNTLQLSIVKLLLNTFMAVIISLLLHEMRNIYFKKTVQTIIYLPHFMSWVVVASIFKMILSTSSTGMINSALLDLKLIDTPIEFLSSTKNWRGVYYMVNIWKDTGWGTILFLATLSGISPELYEAAQIDGANRFNRMKFITLPALYNTIITVFILNLAKVMNLFESVFVMYNPNVYDKADVLQTYIYRSTFGGGAPNYGYTTAVGLFRSVVSCALVLICNYASKKVRGRGIV